MKTPLGRLAAFGIVLVATVACTAAPSASLAQSDRVAASVQTLLSTQSAYSSADVAAWDCLAAIAAAPGADPGLVKAKVAYAADWIVAHPNPGPVGWGLDPDSSLYACGGPGTLATFDHKVCNPRYTSYMFQSGLAITCLARAYELTGKAAYVETARAALDASWNFGAHPAGCPDCFAYWYSYHANDAQRVVRAANVLMGMALAWTWDATHDPRYRRRAREVGNAEARELKAGNFGYFSIDDDAYLKDPAGESQRIENHVPYVAKGLDDMGALLGIPAFVRAGEAAMRSFIECANNRCVNGGCDSWTAQPGKCHGAVTFGPCFESRRGGEFKDYCDRVMAAEPHYSNYELWAILDGAVRPSRG